MSTEILKQTEQDSQLSPKLASEMFGILFEDPKNIDVVADLFKWLPGVAREQKIQEAIRMAKWWLGDLKNNYNNTIV